MKRCWNKLAFLAIGIAIVATQGMLAAQGEEDLGPAGNLTVITSERLTFDYQKQYALFETNVVVTDPEMKLTADRMRVEFDEDSHIEEIQAEGNVVIEQEDKTAWAGRANYDVKDGKMTLKDNPRVRRGRDILEGEVITFWRDENKMICEPQARLVIFPQKGGTRNSLFGE